jgi:hypothetical protein
MKYVLHFIDTAFPFTCPLLMYVGTLKLWILKVRVHGEKHNLKDDQVCKTTTALAERYSKVNNKRDN